MSRNQKKLVVDECLDANGHYTIRPADGSPNGDTEAQPVATVYEKSQAELIVKACNLHQEIKRMISALDECQEALDFLVSYADDEPAIVEDATELAMRVREILREAKDAAAKRNG